MILKGSQRGGAKALALHLLNEADNDHVEVHSVKGFMCTDVEGALQEIQAIARGTNCKQFMFSLSLSPPEDAIVSDQDFFDAIRQSMEKLGLTEQPHVVIFHEKNARRHCHVVISRIDTGVMKAINLPFFKDRLMELSRELYLTHGWNMPKGHEDRMRSDPLNYTLEEHQVAKRAKRDPKILKALLQECWARSDSNVSFASALQENGLMLCRGDRRGFVAVDAQGTTYSLSRWLGVKTKDLRARLGDPSWLPDIETALDAGAIEPQGRGHGPVTAQFDAKMAKLLRQKEHLKGEQRQARLQLRELHQRKKLARTTELRAATSGLQSLWDWATGKRQQVISARKAVLEKLDEHALTEALFLSKRQRDVRRVLQDKITALQAWRDTDLGRVDVPAQGQNVDTPVPNVEELRLAARVRETPTLVLDMITEHKGRFTRNDILRNLGKYIPDSEAHLVAIDTVMASENLVLVEGGKKPTYSTREFLTLEDRTAGLAKTMASTKAFGVSPGNLKSAIQSQNRALQKSVGANLSAEQRRAITHLVNRRQMSAVIGFAGSGKSTMLSAARDAWEQQGYRVLGAALAGKAADGLQSASGIPSRTLASYELSWKNGRNLLQPGDVLVVDEAGMIGSRQLVRFIEEAYKRRAKLVLVGDPDQLQPINAGTPFRDITDQIGSAKLTEIRRQKHAWQRQASLDLAEGRVADALAVYENHGAIQSEATQDAAIAALIEDYMVDWETTGEVSSRLVLAHSRADVRALNERIRSVKKSAGELVGEITLNTEHGARAFAAGDRIQFTRNDAHLGVKNGTLGTVKVVDADKVEVLLDRVGNEIRRKLSINLGRYQAIDHGYAVTIHRSQGATVDNCFVLGSRSMDDHLKYVAMTRHKKQMQFYQYQSKRPTNHFSEPALFQFDLAQDHVPEP
ncbi:AAA family ATPase [Sulfitobacter mediterraneus]|uniref:AAA family ATPase n=1 Tax=Sulfitobacter mediterraneus TaxID=83219 RepID=UPI00193ACBE8|nr:AAA family ATPase [Sulfitobacter mediterraneus]MBM1556249.1 AAA family ATPase [Sulfitobacter mediterraneus]MBM1567713.1 AAA family ATPase [Sulfitobacter mediterraneus]MBM1571603.1 AAA family ATPase [Sulfitobacter mediterraneus]MBM1575391.1 AAA family ATPase [Sulfitobacter mediterraneus]MBM1579118.1 AAA family ATPase [Sulfitobacter mediterraneus]